jgi:hypothetical protein
MAQNLFDFPKFNKLNRFYEQFITRFEIKYILKNNISKIQSFIIRVKANYL